MTNHGEGHVIVAVIGGRVQKLDLLDTGQHVRATVNGVVARRRGVPDGDPRDIRHLRVSGVERVRLDRMV